MVVVLGEGSYGSVVQKGKRAVKTCALRALGDDFSGWMACARELHCGGFVHPHICKRYGVRAKALTVCLRMELGTPFLVRDADPSAVLVAVGSALQFLHVHGIVHRDVKPQNLILVRGVIKLIDFGLARPTCRGNEMLTGYTVSRWWRPPELLTSDADFVYTGKCDMWSLGVVYYQCLHKKIPFHGTAHEMLDMMSQFQPGGVLRHLLVSVKERFTSTALMRWLDRTPHRHRVRVRAAGCCRCRVPPAPPAVRQVVDQYKFRKRKSMRVALLMAYLVCGYEDDALRVCKILTDRGMTHRHVLRRLTKLKKL